MNDNNTFTLPLAQALAMASLTNIRSCYRGVYSATERVVSHMPAKRMVNVAGGFEKGTTFEPALRLNTDGYNIFKFAEDATVTIDENGTGTLNEEIIGVTYEFDFLMTRPFTAVDAGLEPAEPVVCYDANMPDAEALTHDPVTGIIGAASDAYAGPSSPAGLMRVWMFGG